jgi:hypothetical protein
MPRSRRNNFFPLSLQIAHLIGANKRGRGKVPTCNAGKVSVFITTEELSSDAKTAFTAPKLLKKNKTARIDLARYIALLPLLKTSMRNHERPLAYVTGQQMCQDRSLLGQSKKCENQEILGSGSLTRAIVEKKT